ncbi:MAG: cob(I)yrinic acid a,c-diamide adenosyltransferase [Candidatus Omnitrophica bacterium]|nr:cob(I)yrinic acid a,c-diamide adenosyltransferase [Candidatus Omnitrophota bacterium]
MKRKGIVFSGDGKGKTSAAIGIAVRMVAQKKKVAYCTFFKQKSCSELKVLKKLTDCKVFTFCEKYPSFSAGLTKKKFKDLFKKEWSKFLAKFYSFEKYHLLVIDELLMSL